MSTQLKPQTSTIVSIENPVFQSGYDSGRNWCFYGDFPGAIVTDEQIVDFIKDNILELDRENFLPEERLIDNIAFLIGWVSGNIVPERKEPHANAQ